MSAPSPNADPERGEVPNTAAVVTRKWGTLRNFAANEEGRRKLNRAAAEEQTICDLTLEDVFSEALIIQTENVQNKVTKA